MSFRFNFCSESEKSAHLNIQDSKDHFDVDTHTENESLLARCDFISDVSTKLPNTGEDICRINIGAFEIKYVIINSAKVKTKDEILAEVDALGTDIIPGKYEGGLKVWECSIDLAMYLENNCVISEDSVLELGCGAGLPGVVAYLKGANVTFQDFNSEVLELVTVPNTVLNTSLNKICKIPEVCQYLYGDWEAINKKYYCASGIGKKYDIILTSETIYEKSNQKKLLELMKSALKSDGRIYLAAKIYYFGVGGGITDFETLVNEDQTFEISLLKRITDGVERQILMMKFKT